MPLLPHELAGQRAEARVLESLRTLPSPWQVFPTVEWRNLNRSGEEVGEADVVVFHPQHGLAVFEIKAGAVEVRDGRWFYGSGLPMKQSPFSQARRNRYALAEKLKQRLGKEALEGLGITHAAWFPDVHWQGPMPGTDTPSRAFLFDRVSLSNPEPFLQKMWREASPYASAWTKAQQQVLKELLAPDCHQLVPLASTLDSTLSQMHAATAQQIHILRLLRTQNRLLVEGCAGSGKTLLATTLAREHAALGKRVLLTCYNTNLARHLAGSLADTAGITVLNFHDLTKSMANEAGLPFSLPTDPAELSRFYIEECPEILLGAVDAGCSQFDSIIVDEAMDFHPTWWIALEGLGATGFSWYCFYDRHQSIYLNETAWVPPFAGASVPLDANLRNTRPIGEFAAALGHCPVAGEFLVSEGIPPKVLACVDFSDMAHQLRCLLRDLIEKERIAPERIVVLAPYRHTNPKSTWAAGLNQVTVNLDMTSPMSRQVRVGTIPGFKGLEADVVVLAGLDASAMTRLEWLYVGASRAKGVLFVLKLDARE